MTLSAMYVRHWETTLINFQDKQERVGLKKIEFGAYVMVYVGTTNNMKKLASHKSR